ncbi:MAG: hemolysin family protein [Paracoccaceae bacterium]|nr:hemolysin family protein [Paracoccaceae bacterium]
MQNFDKKKKKPSFWENVFRTEDRTHSSDSVAADLPNLSDLRVDDIAVPKADIIAAPEDSSLQKISEIFRKFRISRIPIFQETLDNPLGFLHLKDFALGDGFNKDHNLEIKSKLRPLIFIPPSMNLGTLLQKMQAERIHMALVIDEYGGVEGLVTIEDLLEEIVGEIIDEHDQDEDQLWAEEKPNIFLVNARLELDMFKNQTGVNLRNDSEQDEEYETIGGLVNSLTNRIPVRGEVIKDQMGNEFSIVEADARRIKRLRLKLSKRCKRENANSQKK